MNRNRVQLVFHCLVLSSLIINGFKTSSTETHTSTGIIVEDANKVLTDGLEYSTGLIGATRSVVSSKVTVGYTSSIFEVSLVKVEGLSQIANTVTQRIIVEYANSVLNLNLVRPYTTSAPQEEPIPPSKSQTETPKQVTNLFSSQCMVQLPNGNTLRLNCSTTSDIVEDLTQDLSNNRIFLRVNESREGGYLIISMPLDFFKAYNSSIDKLVVTIDGKEFEPTSIRKVEEKYLLRLDYKQGKHKIDIYYLTFSLTVRVRSIFDLPVSDISVTLEWPNGALFKTLRGTSSGVIVFDKVPSLNSPYTLYVEQGPFSFQYIPKQILINQDSESSFIAYLYYDTFIVLALFLIVSVVSWKIRRRKNKMAGDEKTKLALRCE